MLFQTGAAYVSTVRIHNMYRVILLGMDNVSLVLRLCMTPVNLAL